MYYKFPRFTTGKQVKRSDRSSNKSHITITRLNILLIKIALEHIYPTSYKVTHDLYPIKKASPNLIHK